MVVNLPKKYDLAVGKVLNRMKNAYLTELVKKAMLIAIHVFLSIFILRR